MPDLGNRANVMGPQPLSKPVEPPAEMKATALKVASLLATGKRSELEQLAMPNGLAEVAALADAMAGRKLDAAEIIGLARVNLHYFAKLTMVTTSGEPFRFQLRLGQKDGRWLVWEALNLSDKRSAWTK